VSADTNPPSHSTDLVEADRRPTKHWHDWAVRIGKALRATETLAQEALDASGGAPAARDNYSGVAPIYVEGDDNEYRIGIQPSALAALRAGGERGPPGQDGEPGEPSCIPGPKGDKGDTGASGGGGSGTSLGLVTQVPNIPIFL